MTRASSPARVARALPQTFPHRLEVLPLGAFPAGQPFPIGVGVVHRAAHAADIHQPPGAPGDFRRVLFQADAAFLIGLTIVLVGHGLCRASDDSAHRAALPAGERVLIFRNGAFGAAIVAGVNDRPLSPGDFRLLLGGGHAEFRLSFAFPFFRRLLGCHIQIFFGEPACFGKHGTLVCCRFDE